MTKKFTGIVVEGRSVTTSDGVKAGFVPGPKPMRMSTELTDEQIAEFQKVWDQTGTLITNTKRDEKINK